MDDPTERRHNPPLEVQVAVMANDVSRLVATVSEIDKKVDSMYIKMQRIEGVVAVVRFLGIGGVLIAIFALAKAFGVDFGGH